MSSSEPPKFRIAIAGAGIAGLTAAIALRKHPLIDVQLYEQATELKEIGASIALGPNGLRTLERLGLHNAISDDVCFRGPSNLPMIYRHWKTGEVIGNDKHEDVDEYLHRTARYHRSHLHGALLENVPRESIHLGKRVEGVDVLRNGVNVRFKDGTEVGTDILIGADGLRSAVRQYFVPDFKLLWSGWTAYRTCFDASLTESIPDLPEDSTHWWCQKTSFFSSKLGKNSYTVVGGIHTDPDDPNAQLKYAEWDEKASVQAFRDLFADWNPIVKALTEVTPSVRLYPNLSCATTLDSWIFDNRVVLIGDAAHAHGGAHATGGSLAIDDAYALSLALFSSFPVNSTETPSLDQITAAMKLYEKTRKPHAERLLKFVHANNDVRLEKLRRGVEESDGELRARAAKGSNTTWLHEHDVVKTFQRTLRSLETNGGASDEARPRL
ncbi:FAD/NAD(P)-binding domain-containing protein [Mollisia scopiformis]|uniref:FAD/NAD(P)-binding domain-containing protein n=1 Tax=Mollisia scopiformis TaxID=149040 RepID=A0A194WTN0_MOLSC|nr:FAD/NAD(P)-binding domain-containing protein [Mollisia scopiformis]KUJ11310.1 FAD/NAD(P)-binding domain-containing protein [Mollisia scopiformis]